MSGVMGGQIQAGERDTRERSQGGLAHQWWAEKLSNPQTIPRQHFVGSPGGRTKSKSQNLKIERRWHTSMVCTE